jgi:opacity protein-like surface antigen
MMWWMVAVLVAVLGVPAASAATVVLPRPGQVGVGLQGGWGTLLQSGELGGAFGNGPNLAVRLRYRMRYERAFGLSFEGQRLDIRQPEAEFPPGSGLAGRTSLKITLSGLDFYQMFSTRTRTTKMLSIGAGLAQTSAKTANDETVYPGDGFYLSVGAGLERFLFKSWALDLSTRYEALFLPEDRNHDVQANLGLIFYASY